MAEFAVSQPILPNSNRPKRLKNDKSFKYSKHVAANINVSKMKSEPTESITILSYVM